MPEADAEIKIHEHVLEGLQTLVPYSTLGGSSKLSRVLCHYQPFSTAFPQNIKVNTFHYLHSTIRSELNAQEETLELIYPPQHQATTTKCH